MAVVDQMHATIFFTCFRPNIFLEEKGRPTTYGSNNPVEASYDEVLLPILEGAMQQQRSYPKTIIYMPLQWCSYAHGMAC